jgi:hypothetical protein
MPTYPDAEATAPELIEPMGQGMSFWERRDDALATERQVTVIPVMMPISTLLAIVSNRLTPFLDILRERYPNLAAAPPPN